MAFRRRRKPLVQWLPNQNKTNSFGSNTQGSNFLCDRFINCGRGDDCEVGFTNLYSITADDPPEIGGYTDMAPYQAGGYRLRRIVGKCFLALTQQDEDTAPAVLVTAAFIILRVDDNGQPLRAAANVAEYSPLRYESERDPWIWRRSWVLGNGQAQVRAQYDIWDEPFSNSEYGSVQDGPHIDQKTARTVSAEERVFFILTGANLGTGTVDPVPVANNLSLVLDYRLLASPLKAMGNRRNASR